MSLHRQVSTWNNSRTIKNDPTSSRVLSELTGCCVKIEVDVLGSPSLIVLKVYVVCLCVAVEYRWMHMNKEGGKGEEGSVCVGGWGGGGGSTRDLGTSIDYLFIFVSEWTSGDRCAIVCTVQ